MAFYLGLGLSSNDISSMAAMSGISLISVAVLTWHSSGFNKTSAGVLLPTGWYHGWHIYASSR
jgi:hypothetical protein